LEIEYVRAGTWVQTWLSSFSGFNYFIIQLKNVDLMRLWFIGALYILRKFVVWWLLCMLLVLFFYYFSLFFLVGPTKLFQIIFLSFLRVLQHAAC